MRIFIILLVSIAIYSTAFINTKCDHVYTAIEQPEIKVAQSAGWTTAVYTAPPTGKHEGPELICVKCFHKQRQVLDYGSERRFTGIAIGTDIINPFFLFDTVTTANSGRTMVIKSDTLIWSK
jgi:hypothetical protein